MNHNPSVNEQDLPFETLEKTVERNHMAYETKPRFSINARYLQDENCFTHQTRFQKVYHADSSEKYQHNLKKIASKAEENGRSISRSPEQQTIK